MSVIFESPKPWLRNTLRHSIAATALLCAAEVVAPVATAQNNVDDPANHGWQAGAIGHAQRMRAFFDRNNDQQTTPPVVPSFQTDSDPFGSIATTQPGGATQTSQNPFFANLGTNNRTCFTCHQPQTGWTVSAASVQSRFNAGQGTDPIFRLIDGATCPSDDISNVGAKLQAYSLLLSKGLIRIGLQVPTTVAATGAPTEYRIVSVSDPYGCSTNPFTGLTNFGPSSPTTGVVSVYRRPLPSTNLGFLTTIMWDGREPSLASQSVDATRIHAQSNADPSTGQQQQIVNFESGIFTAQVLDNNAQNLKAAGANGGPDALANLLPGFYVGINDPLGGNPKKLPFTSQIFDLYQAFNSVSGGGPVNAARHGYTLLLVIFGAVTNATLYDKLNYNFIRDIAPVAGVGRVPNVLVVHPSVPAKTVPELIAYAKANPAKLNMASAGNGSSPHVAGELFKTMTNVNMAHVPYRGGAPAITDLIGGQVQVMFSSMPDSIEYVRAGKLRRWQ
jgi:hypothetical protein